MWGLTPIAKNIERVQILQNKCVRIMTFAPFRADANPIFQQLKLLKIEDIIKCEQLKLVNDFYCNRLPISLTTLFQLSKDVHTADHTLNSIYYNLLHIPSFNTVTYGKKSLKYHCAKLWNNTFKHGNIKISSDKKVKLTEIETKNYFKKVLKMHFMYLRGLE